MAAHTGFTLVEVLTVMSIIIILLALAVPTIRGLSANQLSNSGRLFTNLLTIARSEAINRRTIVRVEIATNWPPDPTLSFRRATIAAATLNAAGAYVYRQITGWETLPQGVIFEPTDPVVTEGTIMADGSLYFLDATNNLNNTDTSDLSFAGTPIPTVYFAFTPSGGLTGPAGTSIPIRIRLTEGVLPVGASSVTYIRASGSKYGGANWFDVRVNPLVGRLEIGRPESPLPNS